MSTGAASEIAYDLLRDNLELVLGLIDAPAPRAQLARRAEQERTLNRLIRHGVLVDEGGLIRAASSVYEQARQESMMSFLSELVLPALTTITDDSAAAKASLSTCLLRLDAAKIARMHDEVLVPFVQDLLRYDDVLPLQGPAAPLHVLVMGTSRLDLDAAGEPTELALRQLRQASAQRTNPEERNLAMIAKVLCNADSRRHQAGRALCDQFVSRFSGEVAPTPESATYYLGIATWWQSAPEAG